MKTRRTSRLWAAGLAAALALGLVGGQAGADEAAEDVPETERVKIQVIEVAGGRAFIEPGEAAGLRVGVEVRIRSQGFKVVGVTRETAVIELGEATVREGDRGHVRVKKSFADGGKPGAPAPLSTFVDQWGPPTLPAGKQAPRHVPIGALPGSGYQVRVYGTSAAIIPLGEGRPVTHVSVGARLRAEPWQEVPFGVDAEVAASMWLGRRLGRGLAADSRPYLSVRELRLRYGDAAAPFVGLGRLRYAASSVGLLDGVRVESPALYGTQVAAFGGFVPNTLDGQPDVAMARFGAEATYRDPRSSWRPLVHVVAQGSQFDGALDERRVATFVRLFPKPVSILAHAELSFFDADNPWGAGSMELTAAGVDASVRTGSLHGGVRLDLGTPERSRWLASLLPPSWLCTAEPQPPGQPEPCNGERNARYSGMVTGGFTLARFSLSAAATAVVPDSGNELDEVGGFVDARVLQILGKGRLGLGVMTTRSSFLDTFAGRVEVGAQVRPDVDVSWYYRPAILSYTAALESWLEHRTGAEVYYTLETMLDVAVTVEATSGPDVTALGVFATAVWQPRL